MTILSKSDICFLSTGVMVYEALNFNKLIFAKNISANQKSNFRFLVKNKLVFPLNYLRNLRLNQKNLDQTTSKINQLAINYNNSVIFKLLIEPILDTKKNQFYLEHFSKDYLKNIFELQTQDFRKYYINPNTFSFKSHVKYYQKIITDKNLVTFIIKNENSFVGYIKTHYKKQNVEVSISINKNYQNKGLATKLLRYLVNNNFFLKKPIAKINRENINSIKAFKNAGFENIKYF